MRGYQSRAWSGVVSVLLIVVMGPLVMPAMAEPIPPPTFADPAFQTVWDRYDRPVFYGEASRSYTWGAQVSGGFHETYEQGPQGSHLVQYFEKSRMEINDPAGDPNRPFFVTQGLLARDMIYGQIQQGDGTFQKVEPAPIPFGDLDDTAETSPTYASFGKVLTAPPVAAGQLITATIVRAGNVTTSGNPRGVTSVGVPSGVTTGHSIASVFAEFLGESGVVYAGGRNATEPVFAPAFYVTGYPITEAYWARVKASGAPKDVLIQCFERRCLTYTPDHDPTFRVELANTGLQYYEWRYPRGREDRGSLAIGNVAVLPASTSTVVTFTTNQDATVAITVYRSADLEPRTTTTVTIGGAPKRNHAITLLGLGPETQYTYRLTASNADGQTTTPEATFTTTR